MKWLKSWKCLINQDAGPGRDRLFLTCQVSAPEMPNTSVPARQLTSVIGNAGSGENLLFPVSGVGQLSNAKASDNFCPPPLYPIRQDESVRTDSSCKMINYGLCL